MARGLVCNIVPGACSSGHELVIVAGGLYAIKCQELVVVAMSL